jgi:glycosyltransferase involved in cell wall biosynthesis
VNIDVNARTWESGRKLARGAEEPVDVSVVIPCLNEAHSIECCIHKAASAFIGAHIRGEVVVADNGSTDGSIEIAQRHGARVVHALGRGYGSALRQGIAEAKGQFIIIGDADDSYDFSEAPRFVAKWREGYELVMGNRFKGGVKPGAMPWHHYHVGNPALTIMLNLFFRAGVGDSQCGMRGFTRELYDRLDIRTTGMEFASELVIKAARQGARRTEIPITLWPDKRRRAPHLKSFPDGWRHLRLMLLYAPNWLFLLPGSSLLVFGAMLLLWLLAGPRRVGNVVFDVHTMLFGTVFALLGAQIVSIGFFAKVFSYTERFSHSQHSLERWLKRVKLEHALILGAIVAAGGAAGSFWVGWKWAISGFGLFHDIRPLILFSLWFFLGVQIIFSAFFLSMLGISRETYIGDYDLN